jgi:hypothetical protein
LFIAIPVLVLAVASNYWIVYRHSRTGFSRCLFRCQKEQGVCVDRRPNQKYFIDLTASDKSYIVYLR